MLLYVILAVFIGGLMVGRTPEYLGKKIGAREIKLVSLGVLVTPLVVLLSSGLASATEARHALALRRASTRRASRRPSTPTSRRPTTTAPPSPATPASSSRNAPGNAGAYGISFADLLGGVVMVGARFLPILFVLAVAGSLAGKKVSPGRPGDDAHRQPDLRLPPGRRS